MLRDLKLEVFYPHPPQKIWQAIANRRALAAWMMENDFEPRLGHKFRFSHPNLPGVTASIDCEVIELDEPSRLSFTWRDGMMLKPSVVTYTLKSVEGGTKVLLEHKGLLQQVETLQTTETQKAMCSPESWQGQLIPQSTGVTRTLVAVGVNPSLSLPVGQFKTSESVILSSFINGGWEYKLKEKLAQLLEN
ncbi:MAG: SRPBCC domain-containing protein [Scytonematopsis contorta HA4267-MV1]|jgi:uncharacterized protein YndB with AHSA1/START domain|nr:SRPBCC domain-containing protein [Scytonematopsis contorta HA4267-MV1]